MRKDDVPVYDPPFEALIAKVRCDRCARPMTSHIVSFFTEEAICMDCLQDERQLLARLRQQGVRVSTLAGCGYLPHD